MKMLRNITLPVVLLGLLLGGSNAIAKNDAQDTKKKGALYTESGQLIGVYSNESEYLRLQFGYLKNIDSNAADTLSKEALCIPGKDKDKDGLVYVLLHATPDFRADVESVLKKIESYDMSVDDGTKVYHTFGDAVNSRECQEDIRRYGIKNVFVIETTLGATGPDGKPEVDENMDKIMDMTRIYDLNGNEAVDISGKGFEVNAKGIW